MGRYQGTGPCQPFALTRLNILTPNPAQTLPLIPEPSKQPPGTCDAAPTASRCTRPTHVPLNVTGPDCTAEL